MLFFSGPMCEGNPQYPLLSNLSKNVEALTEFKVWPIQGITSSECYRVRAHLQHF